MIDPSYPSFAKLIRINRQLDFNFLSAISKEQNNTECIKYHHTKTFTDEKLVKYTFNRNEGHNVLCVRLTLDEVRKVRGASMLKDYGEPDWLIITDIIVT